MLLVALLALSSAAAGWWRFFISAEAPRPDLATASDGLDVAETAEPPWHAGAPAPTEEEVRDAVIRFASFGLPLSCGGGNEPVVALTLDGPGPGTERMMEVLRDRGVPASFFLAGERLEDGLRLLLTELRELGDVGNGSWSDEPLAGAGPKKLTAAIDRAQAELATTSDASVRFFRPPHGEHDEAVAERARSLGTILTLWSAGRAEPDGDLTPEEELEELRAGIKPGAIIRLPQGADVAVLRGVVDVIEARGLTPVRLSELLAIDPPTRRQMREGTCP